MFNKRCTSCGKRYTLKIDSRKTLCRACCLKAAQARYKARDVDRWRKLKRRSVQRSRERLGPKRKENQASDIEALKVLRKYGISFQSYCAPDE